VAAESDRAGPAVSLYKTIIKSSAIYSIAVSAPLLVSFIMLPVYTRILTPADYGVLELLETTRNIFAMFVGGRFADALLYHYAKAEPDERADVAATSMTGSIGIGIMGMLLGWALSPWFAQYFGHPEWTGYFYLLFAGFCVSLPVEAGLAWLRARNEPTRFAGASIARLLVAVLFSVVFVVYLRMGIAGVLWSSIVTHALISLYLAGSCLWPARPTLFSTEVFGRMVRFAIPLSASGLALFIIHSGDRFFLQRWASLEEIGLYGLAYKMGMLVSYAQMAFSSYWFANIYHIVRDEDGLRIWSRTNTYQLLVLIYAGLGIAVFATPVITLLGTARFLGCAKYVPWIAAAYVIRSEGDFFRSALHLDGRVGRDARLNWSGAIICLIAYATLIPLWKSWGAIAATTVTFAFLLVLAWKEAVRLRPYYIETKRLVLLSITAVSIVVIAKSLQHGPWITQCLVAVAAALAYPALLWALRFFTTNEKQALAGIVRSARTRIATVPGL
jgi:O-antigen/teichoic acid export membrane protein